MLLLPALNGGGDDLAPATRQTYHAAHARGVKIIGATSHFVTAEFDARPIMLIP